MDVVHVTFAETSTSLAEPNRALLSLSASSLASPFVESPFAAAPLAEWSPFRGRVLAVAVESEIEVVSHRGHGVVDEVGGLAAGLEATRGCAEVGERT